MCSQLLKNLPPHLLYPIRKFFFSGWYFCNIFAHLDYHTIGFHKMKLWEKDLPLVIELTSAPLQGDPENQYIVLGINNLVKKNYFFYDFIFFQQIFRLLSPAPLFLRAGTQAAFLGCSVPEQKLSWVLSEVKMTIDLWSWRRLSLFQVLLPHAVQLRHLGWRHQNWHNHDDHHIFLFKIKITHFWSKVFERKVTLCLT